MASSDLDQLDGVVEWAVAEGHTPGIMVGVADREGVRYEGTAGARTLDGGPPMTVDTVFRAFSMSKAVGAAAAAKAIEDGLLTLETPVADVLDEWKTVRQLDGFDNNDQPVLVEPTTTTTLRHLATHTSGLAYEFWRPEQAAYMEATGDPTVLSGTLASLQSYPLVFESGTGFAYGIGIDWLGLMVATAAGESIVDYVTGTVLEPCGMGDTTFEPRPDMTDRLTDVHMATPEGFRPHELAPPPKPELYGLGHCLYTTGPDYLRFIRMLLSGGEIDGTRVLAADTMAMFTANQIGDLIVPRLETQVPPLTGDVDLFPEQDNVWSLGCLVNTAHIEGRRRAGSQSWAGVLNTHYWFDPAAGVAAVIMLQHLPFVDDHALTIYDRVERTVYDAIG